MGLLHGWEIIKGNVLEFVKPSVKAETKVEGCLDSKILSQVRKEVIKVLGIREEDLYMNSTKESIGMDSLDEIEVIMAIEEEFDICIDEYLYESTCETLKDLVLLVQKLINE